MQYNNDKLINANEYELYNIIKKNYKFNSKECYISNIQLDTFKNFKNLLKGDNYFDWDFCIKYSFYIKNCWLSFIIADIYLFSLSFEEIINILVDIILLFNISLLIKILFSFHSMDLFIKYL